MFTSSLLNPDRTPSKQKAFLVGVQFDKLHTYRIPRRDRRSPAENPAPEGRPNIAQRRGPQHARFWRDGVEGFSAGTSERNDPGGTTASHSSSPGTGYRNFVSGPALLPNKNKTHRAIWRVGFGSTCDFQFLSSPFPRTESD